MEYIIASGGSVNQITETVECFLKEGWIPIGGVSSIASRTLIGHFPNGEKEYIDVIAFHQAMTRTCKPKATSRSLALLKTGAVVDAYNTYFRINNKKVSFKLKVTAKLETRLRICIEKEFKTITEWTNYFELIAMSDFLMGEIPPRDGFKQFRLSLDYITNETNIAKILEGNFNNE